MKDKRTEEKSMITTILWDVDATLLDFLAAEKAAIKKLFQEFDLGECTDEMIRRYSKNGWNAANLPNRRYWSEDSGSFLRRKGSAVMWRKCSTNAISYVWEIPSCFGMTVMKS